ncbi:hypothetical protein X797_008583 [Metarhizium robertsii]|uniref:Uncharacterized protein n=1 Tax=Metarhizium robertsii TaxID=568076 RepID=A0A0A1URW2_9HYPO|nr:hypothetical protein X797_008583 [Metarhizium robertsii]
MYLHLHSFALQPTTLKYHASAPLMEKAWDFFLNPLHIEWCKARISVKPRKLRYPSKATLWLYYKQS